MQDDYDGNGNRHGHTSDDFHTYNNQGDMVTTATGIITTFRTFTDHTQALTAQRADVEAGYTVSMWAAYQGTTEYVVTLPAVEYVKREGQS